MTCVDMRDFVLSTDEALGRRPSNEVGALCDTLQTKKIGLAPHPLGKGFHEMVRLMWSK